MSTSYLNKLNFSCKLKSFIDKSWKNFEFSQMCIFLKKYSSTENSEKKCSEALRIIH